LILNRRSRPRFAARTVTACLLVAGVAAFLSTPANAYDAYQGIHTIGVIPVIGDKVRFRGYGMVAIDGPVSWDLDVSDWKIDQDVQSKIASMITPRFTVKTVQFDAEKFYTGPYTPYEPFERRMKLYISQLPKSNDVDAYILVHKRFMNGDANPPIFGLQVCGTRSIFSSDVSTETFVSYEIKVIDARTGSTLQSDQVALGGGHQLFYWSNPRSDEPDLWAASADKLTADQKDRLKRVVRALVTDNLGAALERLGLASEDADTDAPDALKPH